MPTRGFARAIRLVVLRAALAALFVVLALSQTQAQTRDIILFADASLKNALDEANNLFLFENAMRVVVSYDSSAALARRIESGMQADVFISASPDAMDSLARRNLIEPDTRADLVGKPPIVYPIAILSGSTNVLASIYVQYLRSPKATPFFEKQGFVVLP